MRKFTLLLFGILLVLPMSAQRVQVVRPLRGATSPFLKSESGKINTVSTKMNFKSLSSFPTSSTENDNTVLLQEDFSAMKAGSEGAIDTVDLIPNYLVNGDMKLDSKWTQTPGWTGISIHQAGGCCALYHPNFGGVLNTPQASYYGKIKITFRAKSISDQCLLYVAIAKGDPAEPDATSSDYYAKSLTAEDGWVDCSYEIVNPYDDKNCFIQFNAYDDGAFLDDIKIVSEDDYIAAPPELTFDYFTHDGFTAYWKKVSSAKDYLVSLYQFKERGNTNTTVEENFNGVKYDEKTGLLDATNPNIPAGWKFELNPDSDQMVKSGIDSTTAVCLSSEDSYIETPEDGGHILNFTFSLEKLSNGTKQDKAPAIIIKGWDGSDWCDIFEVFASTKIGEVITVNSKEIEDSYTENKPDFSLYTKWKLIGTYIKKNGKLAIDNISFVKTPAVDTLLVQKDVVTPTDSIKFTGLDMNSEYYITVKSRNSKDIVSDPTALTHAYGVAPPVAIAATNVDSRGSFTANWQAEDKANEGYVVDVKKSYKAQADVNDYPVLSENFSNVTSTGTKENPESVDNYSLSSIDAYTSTVGWLGIGNVLVKGMLGCSQPASGINAILTPALKLDNGDKTFKVKVKAYGTFGDTLIVQNGTVNNDSIAYNADGVIDGSLTFNNGKNKSIIYFYSAGSQQFFLDDVTVSQNMKIGESVSSIIYRKYIDAGVTNYNFDGINFDDDCKYSYVLYSLRYYYGTETVSAPSNEMLVDLTTGINQVGSTNSQVTVSSHNRNLVICTPNSQPVVVCDLTGRVLLNTVAVAGNNSFALQSSGLYLVKVGNSCFKTIVR